jgi:biogenesis of lysosome-related organelles complex 1 subunit 2
MLAFAFTSIFLSQFIYRTVLNFWHGSHCFQGTNNQLALLEKMNDRVAQEYSNYGDVAAGLRVFVEQLNEKNRGFEEYVSQIDAIDQQVTEFEAVVSMLDKHVALLEKKVKSAYHISPSTQ